MSCVAPCGRGVLPNTVAAAPSKISATKIFILPPRALNWFVVSIYHEPPSQNVDSPIGLALTSGLTRRRVDSGKPAVCREELVTITLDIAPEVQAELARRAAAEGRALEAYAANLLEESAQGPVSASLKVTANNLMELCESVRGLLTDEEVGSIFKRNSSTGRPLDLS
jgi:hypothetical protein